MIVGKGVGSMKQEFGYDLNAAAFEYNSFDDDTGNFVATPKEIFGVLFNFTSAASKNVTISLSILSAGTRYIIQVIRKKLPNHYNWIWKPDIELPQNVDITINVSKTATACTMNMVTVDR